MSMVPPVLFVGGAADGRWIAVPANAGLFRVPVPARPTTDLAGPSFEVHDYHVDRFMVFGRTVRVAMLSSLGSADREDAVIKALFQRDVAAEVIG